MVFIRKIRKGGNVYLAKVESYRKNGKIKQRCIEYLGKEVDGQAVRRTNRANISVKSVKQSLDVLVVDEVAGELKIKSLIDDKNVLVLVYSHLLGSRSINRMEEWLGFTEIPEKLGLENVSTRKLYDTIADLSELDFGKVEEHLCSTLKKYETDKEAAIIDVTDTYFEGRRSANGKVRRGKDGKVRKLVQFGLATSMENGFPLFHVTYPGNLSNIQIFKDMGLRMGELGLKSVIIDRGMTSPENLRMILTLGMKTIAGMKKNGSLVKKYIPKKLRNEIYSLPNMVKLKNTEVFIKSFEFMKGRLVVVFNPKVELIRKGHAFEKGINADQQAYGYSLIYHNTNLPDPVVVKKYYEKDTVERAFKQMKGILNLRPVRVWLKKHVESHFKICFLAYAILSYMNFKLKKTGFSSTETLESLKHGYKVRLYDKSNKHEWDLIVPLEPKQKDMLKALGVVNKT